MLSVLRSTPTRERLLHAYLRDHLAGATGGLALARRIATTHRGTPFASELADFATDVAGDVEDLRTVMRAVGASPDPVKMTLAALGERIGRLKANGRLVRRSPLSSVMELELMRLGVEGKASGWRALREAARSDTRIDGDRIEDLTRRAEAQAELLESLRVRAAAGVFGT